MKSNLNIPPYETFPSVISDKIELRQIKLTDTSDIIEISYYDGKKASNEKEASDMLSKINGDYNEGTTIHWGIFDKESKIIVGTCGYYRGFIDNTGELGCILLAEFRGKGYMTSALKLAVDFGISQIGLSKVIAITTKQNSDAIKLLNRLNFIKTIELEDEQIKYEYLN